MIYFPRKHMDAGGESGEDQPPWLPAAPSPRPLAQLQAHSLHQPVPCDFQAYPHILQRIHSTGKPKLDSCVSQALQLTLLNVAKWRECK